MRAISLLGFEGTGIRSSLYQSETGLIQVGHVGLLLTGDSEIYGFHPSPEAIGRAGGESELLKMLIAGESVAGAVQADSSIFLRADALAKDGARTQVWQMDIGVSDEDFSHIRSQILEWYNQHVTFPYAFARRGGRFDDADNCATFPRRLGLSLPEPTGRMVWYMEALKTIGRPWRPK